MQVQEARRMAVVLGPAESRTEEPLNILGQDVLVKIASTDADGAMAVFHLTVPPMSGPPLHRHSEEDEWFYVLDGEVVIEIDGERHVAGAGGSAFAPRGTIHTFQNFTQSPAHMLVMVTPGRFDQFFRDVSAWNHGLAQPDFERLEQLMTDYGMELMGPPLS